MTKAEKKNRKKERKKKKSAADNDDLRAAAAAAAADRPRRLAKVKVACTYGQVSRTKLYMLLKAGTIRAFKRGGETVIDLNSIDDWHESLPGWTPRDAFGPEGIG